MVCAFVEFACMSGVFIIIMNFGCSFWAAVLKKPPVYVCLMQGDRDSAMVAVRLSNHGLEHEMMSAVVCSSLAPALPPSLPMFHMLFIYAVYLGSS